MKRCARAPVGWRETPFESVARLWTPKNWPGPRRRRRRRSGPRASSRSRMLTHQRRWRHRCRSAARIARERHVPHRPGAERVRVDEGFAHEATVLAKHLNAVVDAVGTRRRTVVGHDGAVHRVELRRRPLRNRRPACARRSAVRRRRPQCRLFAGGQVQRVAQGVPYPSHTSRWPPRLPRASSAARSSPVSACSIWTPRLPIWKMKRPAVVNFSTWVSLGACPPPRVPLVIHREPVVAVGPGVARARAAPRLHQRYRLRS